MCNCGAEIETTEHYLLHCRFFHAERLKLLQNLYKLGPSIRGFNNDNLLNLILFGSENFSSTINKNILLQTIYYLKSSGRFDKPLFDP